MSTDQLRRAPVPHPSSRDRPARSRPPIIRGAAGLVRRKSSLMPSGRANPRWPGDAEGDWKASPLVRAFVDAVDATMRAHQPHHALAVTQRTWLAFCLTAVLVTTAMCWARFARASLGTSAMAALSWLFRHRKIPWEPLLVASVRGILRHHGIPSGRLVSDDTDPPRSTSAKALASLYTRREKESGGSLWGHRRVFL